MKLYRAKRIAFVVYGNCVSSRRYTSYKFPLIGWVRGRTLRRLFVLACLFGAFHHMVVTHPFLPLVAS
ncbi:hypothetical protein G4F23_004603 [Salmonella enterica]|nr:hypothetical protein [Salmonella enterica]EEH8327255.1 hypothetical protein [Salmonella enterica]ELO3050664.1 hypothetical protein [Salmonella enterica]